MTSTTGEDGILGSWSLHSCCHGIVLSVGGAELKRAMLPGFLLVLAAGLITAFLA